MRPKPTIPSVFSYSSTPENFERSHLPAISDAYACGMLRASASSSAIVCSAAVTTLDSGALATTIPRLVAATTSTLSTPTPARPITCRRPARSISSAVIFVAERITMPSYSPMRSPSSCSSQLTPISTSKCSRSSATPESPIFSLTSTFARAPLARASPLACGVTALIRRSSRPPSRCMR